MKNQSMRVWALMAVMACSLGVSSCRENDPDPEEEVVEDKVFSIAGSLLNPGGSFLLQTPTLTDGQISFVGNGADVQGKAPNFLAFITKDQFYYSFLPSENTFSKYEYSNQSLNLVKVMPLVLADAWRYWHDWVDENTLIFVGMGGDYKVVDVSTMTLVSGGNLNLPVKEGFNGPNLASVVYKDKKLHVGYWYSHKELQPAAVGGGKTNNATGTAYFAVYDYPSLDQPVYSEDSRSTSPGNDRNGVFKTFEYQDDLYIISSPLELTSGNWDKPTGIFRIKKGQSKVDPDYFFNISEKLNGDHTFGGGYAGNGKLVLRRIRQDLVEKWADYGYKNVQEYHVLDLTNGTFTKLDVPLSKSLSTAPNILTDSGIVYWSVDTKDVDGNLQIYSYEGAIGVLTKGLIVRDIDQINSILRIK